MLYKSTRSQAAATHTAAQIIKQGLAEDGGLFVPAEIPSLSMSEIEALCKESYPVRAAKILSKSQLYIVDDPCFTTKSLINTIREYSTLKQVKTVCFDYIQNNGFVAKELSSETKVPQREDMVLLALTDRLKQVQRQRVTENMRHGPFTPEEDKIINKFQWCCKSVVKQTKKKQFSSFILKEDKKPLAISFFYV